MKKLAHLIVAILAIQFSALRALADVDVSSTQALRAATQRAKPGTRILLAPGRYEPCYLAGMRGQDGKPIVIAAKDPRKPPTFEGGIAAFHIVDSQYVIVDGLIARKSHGNNVQVGGGSHHIVLANVVSKEIAVKGNSDGFKCPDLTDFLFIDCIIESWGNEGSAIDFVGCARGLIARCRLAYPNLNGHTANGIQIKGGSFDMGVYRCHFEDASHRAIQFGGTTGKDYFFRGNLDKGFEAYDCVAMGNVILRGETSVAFVSSRECAFSFNTVMQSEKYITRLLQEGTRPPAENRFSHNLMALQREGLSVNIGGGVEAKAVTFEGNYWRPRKLAPADEREPAGGDELKLDASHRPPKEHAAAMFGAHARGLDEVWQPWTKRFEWAWTQAQSRMKDEGSVGEKQAK